MRNNIDRKTILKIFDLLSDEHLNEIYKIAELFSSSMLCKSDILRYCEIDKNCQIDNSMPIDYIRSIQNILPGFNTMFNVYDYRDNKFGEITNIAELFIKTAHKKFVTH